MSEHQEQCGVIRFKQQFECQYPELLLLHAIPNGAKGNPEMGKWLAAEGVVPGVPDLLLPVARMSRGGSARYSGIYVEMKFGKNKLAPEQEAWASALRAQGFLVISAWTTHEATDWLELYLKLPRVFPLPVKELATLKRCLEERATEKKLAKWRKKNVRRAA